MVPSMPLRSVQTTISPRKIDSPSFLSVPHIIMPQTVIVIATYQELENLQKLLPELLARTDASVLIVDDSSPDGTPEFLRNFAANEPRLIPLIRPGKQGYGTAVLAGLRKALEVGAYYVVTMDADFSHDPADVPKLREAVMSGFDVAVGSRYVNGIRVINWAKSRLLLSLFANLYVKAILGFRVEDATSGFRAYNKKAIEAILAYPPKSRGYSFLSEILFTLHAHNLSIMEVPIIYTERREGQSKMSNSVIAEAILRPWILRLKRMTGMMK